MPVSYTQTQPATVAAHAADSPNIITGNFSPDGNRNLPPSPLVARGPYEALLTTDELAAHLRISVDTVARMERLRQLPPPLRTKPVGSGRGRCVVRWDLWTVCRYLDGSNKE